MRSGAPRQAAEAGVRAAVRASATGRMVVVADDREREDEGDLVAAAILSGLGVHRLRLITNNPHKYGGLSGYDLDLIGRVRTPAAVTAHNIAYLRTKRDRMGHDLDLPVQLAGAT